MKKALLHLILFFACSLQLNSQTYVNESATGMGDGTSWTNAFTDLNDAINSGATEVWIAKGTYMPDSGLKDTLSTFFISKPIKLFGGFAGTETAIEQRNLAANRTILSGDLEGDDLLEDLLSNRVDNVNHILFIDSLLTEAVVIDGIDLTGGSTNGVTNNEPETQWRGGAIFSYSSMEVRNTRIYGNFARSGAGIYISPAARGGDASKFLNVEFNNNRVSSQGAGLFLSGVKNVEIKNCSFVDNSTVRGAFYPLDCDNILLEDCTFERNRNVQDDVSGGAVFSFASSNLSFKNCSFKENSAYSGGAVYANSREIAAGITNATFEDCTFEDNEAIDFGGGALYNWQGAFNIDNCTFKNQTSANSGASMFSNTSKEVNIRNSTFEGGMCNFGGAHSCYGEGAKYTLINNTYKEGTVATSGGGIIVGFLAKVNATDCTFENNSANFGGAVYMQNDTTFARFENCTFLNNTAFTNVGGAINAANGTTLEVNNSSFTGNLANIGGAVSCSSNMNPVKLTNSIFERNTSFAQGGAINVFDSQVEITSSLFDGNQNDGVAGGAISNNAGDTSRSDIVIINSTFYENFASTGSSISQFTSENSSEATVTLQNNIFVSEEPSYGIEAGTPTIISNGGNISYDDSFGSELDGTNDQQNIKDNIFVDPDGGDFNLAGGSPAINNGIEAGAPTTDILGKPRVGAVDAGAYEYDQTNSKETILSNEDNQMILTPNPVHSEMQIILDNNWRGDINISVTSITGQKILQYDVEKSINKTSYPLNLLNAPSGTYQIKVKSNNQSLVSKFIKI